MPKRSLPIVSEANAQSERRLAAALGEVPSLNAGELIQVGELAKATGKTVRAIHLYEELGLLKPANRSKGRYRLFSSDAELRVRWIGKLQHLGLSLTEIQLLVREQEGSDSAMFAAAKLRDVYLMKLKETRNKLAELRALESELEASLEYLTACDSACAEELPVHSCPSCELTPDEAPELVAGVHVN
jgi:DNA-binding transcriptional MerR regulator